MKILSQLKEINVYNVLKESGAVLEGHFRLTSGYHSRYYLQCAKLLQYPSRISMLLDYSLKEVGESIRLEQIETVISPAMGGILFGYLLAFKLDTRMIFTERKDKAMELRRGFEIKPGEQVLIAEDVITTGGSVFEVIEICKLFKACIKGIISIVDRSEGVSFEFPYFSLIKMQIDKYSPQDCPLCLSGVELYYPGSRKQQ